MGKREFDNVLSLRGAYLYATWQSRQNKIIDRDPYVSPMDFLRITILKIGRSLDVFWRKRGMTFDTVILGQQRLTRVSIDPRVKLEGDKSSKSSHRAYPRGQAIFELRKNKLIRSPLEFFASQKIGMTFVLWILISSVSVAATVNATCVPLPNCADIGYTATSCEGGFVRCPFDTTKLYCLPCDNDYKYDCTDNNMTGGAGNTCGGKYASCECSKGNVFNNGACEKQKCAIGTFYYSDITCSYDYDSSKTIIGIVIKDSTIIMSKPTKMKWSSSYIDTSLTNISAISEAQADYSGKTNTLTIVQYHPSETSSDNAALYCNSYSTQGTNAGEWYLPAAGELYSYLYDNYNLLEPLATTLGWTNMNGAFWSSTESNTSHSWFVHSANGNKSSYDKQTTATVSCFRAL